MTLYHSDVKCVTKQMKWTHYLHLRWYLFQSCCIFQVYMQLLVQHGNIFRRVNSVTCLVAFLVILVSRQLRATWTQLVVSTESKLRPWSNDHFKKRHDLVLKTTLKTNSVLLRQISKTCTSHEIRNYPWRFSFKKGEFTPNSYRYSSSYRWCYFWIYRPCCERLHGTSYIKLLTTTSVDYLEWPGHDLWKETSPLSK